MASTSRNKEHPQKELAAASRERLAADRRLSMSERLARLHHLCKQMTEISGSARRHDTAGAGTEELSLNGAGDEQAIEPEREPAGTRGTPYG